MIVTFFFFLRLRMWTSLLQTCSMISYTFMMVFSVSCRLFRTSSGMVKQMEEDKLRFGAAAWASAAPRLEKLRFVLAKETLQHMRTTEMCLNRKQDNIREKVPVIFMIFLLSSYHSLSHVYVITQHLFYTGSSDIGASV